jgi:cytoskeletal protein CcmA (bactofilin family)
MTIRKVKSKKAKDLRLLPLRLRSGPKALCARNGGRNKRGAALLVVLFIVMAITILSLGFLSRSDVELACGENMILRTQMDYLAESGLEHAKGLILSPQDIDTEYWTGAVGQQLIEGSDDYYDVTVNRDDPNLCNYIITCDAYREKNGERIGRSSLEGELRLDPCIAYWAGSATTISQRITINGDVYCNGALGNLGTIRGDVFAANLTGSVDGQLYPKDQLSLNLPGLQVSDFSSQYYIESSSYSVEGIDPNISNASFEPSGSNPGGVRYYNGDMRLEGNVNISGMLVVSGDLSITAANNVISAVKNFPALLVNGEVIVEDGGTLEVRGLAQVVQKITIDAGAENVDIDVVGGLFIVNGGIEGAVSGTVSVNVTAAPAIASIQIWPTPGNPVRWTPAAGAFFRSIERK